MKLYHLYINGWTWDHCVIQSNPGSQRYKSHVFSHIWRMNNNYTLNNEGQECKTPPVSGKVLEGRERWMERAKDGDHGQYTLYAYMKIEHWILSKSF
jgi:hypothetical protein